MYKHPSVTTEMDCGTNMTTIHVATSDTPQSGESLATINLNPVTCSQISHSGGSLANIIPVTCSQISQSGESLGNQSSVTCSQILQTGASPTNTDPATCTQQTLQDEWRRMVTSLYRDLDTRTYCVPPCIMNRVPYGRDNVAGQPTLVLRPSPGFMTSVLYPGSSTSQQAQQAAPTATTPQRQPAPPQQASRQMLQDSRSATSAFAAFKRLLGRKTSTVKSPPTSQEPSPPLTAQQAPRGPSQPTHQGSAQQTIQQTPQLPPSHSSAQSSLWTQEQHPAAQPIHVQESDSRDDFAQQHVLSCFQALGERRQEAMFVMSSLDFTHYLNKLDAAHAPQFPLPGDLPSTHRQGDFDVIILHRQYGVLLGEIKSVGLYDNNPTDKTVADKVTKAVKQLHKCEKVVNHVMSDVAPGVSVRKTLILPYISRARLQQVLNGDSQLAQRVCGCVGAPDVGAAVALCVCSDVMSDRTTPWLVDAAVLGKLEAWWAQRMACRTDPTMTRDLYETLVSRFVGPATTVCVHCVTPPRVEVRTLGEAVSELGRRMALLVLTPGQLDLLIRSPAHVCLTGPPGTGKTVVLVLKGLVGARQGHPVVILNLWPASLAASFLMHQQLVMTLQADPAAPQVAGDVHFLNYDLLTMPGDVEAALQKLRSLLPTRPGQLLHVLMDEVHFTYRNVGPASQRLVRELLAACGPRLSLWAASILNTNIPTELQAETLTVPLRSCPAVLREVAMGVNRLSYLYNYTDSGTPSPSDGPRVIRLRHEGGDHAGRWPVECVRCGVEVARVLTQELHVGVAGANTNPTGGATTTSPPPLQYRDVLVVTRSGKLNEERRDVRGQVTSQASGVVRGLRSAGLPVGVIGWRSDDVARWERDVYDMAVADSDRVTLAGVGSVHGLERRVVVWLPDRTQADNNQRLAGDIVEALDRMDLISRCSTQLVIVDVPRDENK